MNETQRLALLGDLCAITIPAAADQNRFDRFHKIREYRNRRFPTRDPALHGPVSTMRVQPFNICVAARSGVNADMIFRHSFTTAILSSERCIAAVMAPANASTFPVSYE